MTQSGAAQKEQCRNYVREIKKGCSLGDKDCMRKEVGVREAGEPAILLRLCLVEQQCL